MGYVDVPYPLWTAAAIAGVTGVLALASLGAVVFLLGRAERRDLAALKQCAMERLVRLPVPADDPAPASETGTYCPACVEEARRDWPTIEPQPGAAPLLCAVHLRTHISRKLARLELPGGRVVEREVIEVPGYSMIYAYTGEEIAANAMGGWSRALWN